MRRERTNTPLQALMLLNDPQFVEAARALAERTLREGGDTGRIAGELHVSFVQRAVRRRACRRRTHRPVSRCRGRIRRPHPEMAATLLALGELPSDEHLSTVELASWTLVANTVLNLDVVLNKN